MTLSYGNQSLIVVWVDENWDLIDGVVRVENTFRIDPEIERSIQT